MKNETNSVVALLKAFDFQTLFRESLGWDNHRATMDIPIEGNTFHLAAVAEKRGFVAYVCQGIPENETRKKIDRRVTKSTREHLIIYSDREAGEQVWQWVPRELGRPSAYREQHWYSTQSGESLARKLEHLATTLPEEEKLTIVDVTGKAEAAFNLEKTTKKFFDRFTKEHESFMAFITGITAGPDLDWYTSLMLNRLMFVYFIQKKGFLDGDMNYLKNRLASVKDLAGKDKFHSFYRYFLLRLFHDGLGRYEGERGLDPAMEKLLGKVPYLNGGFFEVHHLEHKYPEIDIPDAAFEKVFVFFDSYDWCLDERPTRSGREINPDVVGYIFEKYINQKQMGAYYTKEDITEYISKNTLIPFLFDAAKKECSVAFEPGSFLWRLLQDDPDRYTYPAVRKGVIRDAGTVIPEQELPDFVQAGMKDPNARMFDKRYNLSQAEKDDPIRLPTETWREYVARRARCLEIREKLKAGEVHKINDLITLNLNIWQFARDAINVSEGPELVRAFWRAINRITVLDPTCGSGAFLFAALRILETLYSDCLDAMRRFVEGAASPPDTRKGKLKIFSDFKHDLEIVARHANERYFIFKSIIVNNLYGVDIMEEAVEICKLRLFLKLAAQVATFEDIEPLPDIDFNIRAGNTLVGYATLESLKKGQEGKFLFSGEELADIERSAVGAARIFAQFKEMQTQAPTGPEIIAKTKTAMRQALAKLAGRLDRFLAGEYGIDVGRRPAEFERWKSSHQPFHWLTEFYGVMISGGFEVIVGNPPYVEYRTTVEGYRIQSSAYSTAKAGNLYAFCAERSSSLLNPDGALGMIIPSSAVGLDETLCLREHLAGRYGKLWYSTYSIRPAKLFEGVDQRLCIVLAQADGGSKKLFATRYHHWNTEERSALLNLLGYGESFSHPRLARVAQVGERVPIRVIEKIEEKSAKDVQSYYASGIRGFLAHYHRSPRYWIRAMDFEQHFKSAKSSRSVHHFRDLLFQNEPDGKSISAIINSSLFFLWFVSICNGRNLTSVDVAKFPAGPFGGPTSGKLVAAFDELMRDYRRNSRVRKRAECEYQEFLPGLSKPIIDEIDRALATHYGFTPEELDFIVNYDIKYRMGADEEGDG